MKNNILLFVLLFCTTLCFAQIEKPVKWSFAVKMNNDKTAVILLKADIQKSWHIYSLDQKPGGPVKTTIKFSPNKQFELIGGISQPKPQQRHEDVFGMNVMYFEKTVVFQQKIRVKDISSAVKGSLEFMACNENKCLPPEQLDFTIKF